MGVCIWHEVTTEYVERVSDFGGEFDFTPHKARAQVFSDHAAAQLAIKKTIELYENTVALVIVADKLDDVQKAIGALLDVPPDDRHKVMRAFCKTCWADDPACRCVELQDRRV